LFRDLLQHSARKRIRPILQLQGHAWSEAGTATAGGEGVTAGHF